MARKKQKGNGAGTVYPRKNKAGKVIGYRGSYFGPDGKRRYVSAKRKGDAERALRQAMTDADRDAHRRGLPEPLANRLGEGHRAGDDLRALRADNPQAHRPGGR